MTVGSRAEGGSKISAVKTSVESKEYGTMSSLVSPEHLGGVSVCVMEKHLCTF